MTFRFRRILALLLVAALAPVALAQGGVKKRRPLPDQFGNVAMNFSDKKDAAPVVFSHWVHRAKFTCRLCHVDVGFAMQAGTTSIREEDNRKGFYCGACHNGKIAFASTAFGQQPQHIDFSVFTAGFPKGRFGNNIDWEAAELEGKIKLTDTLPEISVKRRPLDVPKDYSIEAKMAGLPEIIFSHKKHAVWNGCELCHPDIYAVKTGATKYTMEDVFAGKFCGACHGSVAFPSIDCQRCHVKPVVAPQ
jgi:c(7)-type cytochrome triheme protein